jgi:hypothetical protein
MELMQILAAGGDLSTMLLVFVAWRFDKRISHLEWNLGVKLK